MRKSRHLSDAELLLFLDCELTPAESTCSSSPRVQHHLAQCPACSSRARLLESQLADLARLHESTVAKTPTSSLRAALVHDLDALEHDIDELQQARSLPRRFTLPGILSPVAVAAALVVVLVAVRREFPTLEPRDRAPWQSTALPVRSLTPGAIQDVSLAALCGVAGSTAEIPIDDASATKVFGEYGLPLAARNAYEVDYLITPGLGGSSDLHNLWPEPYQSTEWNAHVKDMLEDHLHTLVCEGKLPLETAQTEIAEDWIAAYKKHFHTNTPLTRVPAKSDNVS